MTTSWDATGRLESLWGRVGGRDKLAALTGINAGNLSGYNTGRRPLGPKNAARIAAALEVSIMDLGAPDTTADEQGQILVDRLEGLAEKLAETMEELVRLQARGIVYLTNPSKWLTVREWKTLALAYMTNGSRTR